MSDLRTEPDDYWYYSFDSPADAEPEPDDDPPHEWEWGKDCDGGDMAMCPLPQCYCLAQAKEMYEAAEEEMRVSEIAAKFKYLQTERVKHCDAPQSTFIIIRRWLDVDAPEDANRFYLLRDEKPLLQQPALAPVLECELSLAVE